MDLNDQATIDELKTGALSFLRTVRITEQEREDLVQEVLIAAAEEKTEIENLKAWAHRVAANKYSDMIHSEMRRWDNKTSRADFMLEDVAAEEGGEAEKLRIEDEIIASYEEVPNNIGAADRLSIDRVFNEAPAILRYVKNAQGMPWDYMKTLPKSDLLWKLLLAIGKDAEGRESFRQLVMFLSAVAPGQHYIPNHASFRRATLRRAVVEEVQNKFTLTEKEKHENGLDVADEKLTFKEIGEKVGGKWGVKISEQMVRKYWDEGKAQYAELPKNDQTEVERTEARHIQMLDDLQKEVDELNEIIDPLKLARFWQIAKGKLYF